MPPDEAPIHEDLRAQGWCQGSVLPAEMAENLLGELSFDNPSEWLFIVITQTCDIYQNAEREPHIEVIGARKIDSPEPLYVNRRNPRVLHFGPDGGAGGLCLALSIHDRMVLGKDLFRGHAPWGDFDLASNAVQTLIKWVALRYTRPPFPDEFNRRRRSADKKLERLWKKPASEIITGIFVACSNLELPDDESYEVKVRLTAPTKTWESPDDVESIEAIADRLETILSGCQGIGPVEALAVPERDFTIEHLRYFKRDDRDYRSLPAEEEDLLPPDQIDET